MICQYCNKPARLVKGYDIYPHRPDLAHLFVWQCKPCDAYVGCHRKGAYVNELKRESDGTVPLGTLANRELRAARKVAHDAIDPYWRVKGFKRTLVYDRLAKLMQIPKDECHIGMFDVKRCQEAVKLAPLIGGI